MEVRVYGVAVIKLFGIHYIARNYQLFIEHTVLITNERNCSPNMPSEVFHHTYLKIDVLWHIASKL